MKPCCQDPRNLDVKINGDKTISTCLICGARQIRMKAEPGVIGVRLSRLGKP